ncbi:hypothetical protein FB45DRAFT_137011 [Roridomyces roridus]|uniref:Methyltransferase ausD n=1 Tax=Roridomyces roridus TaxID=1738132 RepID=A0AAD7FHT8_9AGAR|nr:hypothetical protein FB45DRAFT_137011 [Roridomyces roridus]
MENTRPPLDEDLYTRTTDDDLSFIKEQTGIQDPEELKKHIIAVQKKAYDLHGHYCIRSFGFTRTKISSFPVYQHVLALGREQENAIFLDLGCCFGTDIRKAASDGFPLQNLIASDLRPAFWNLGHQLFRSTPETFPVAFLAGDVFDPAFLEPCAPFLAPTDVTTPVPAPLTSLTSLTPLRGHVAAIHISNVFHLFYEPEQLKLAHALAGLLSAAPGSVIFGTHVGRAVKGFREESICSGGHHMFCHSPESWREMWNQVFPKDAIKVDVQFVGSSQASHMDISMNESAGEAGVLTWSVTRV